MYPSANLRSSLIRTSRSLPSFSTPFSRTATSAKSSSPLSPPPPPGGSKLSGRTTSLVSPPLLLVRLSLPPPTSLTATSLEWFVNPKDTGLLHLAALTFPAVTNARIWAVAETFNWTQVQEIFRKIAPGRKFVDLGELGRDLSEIDNSRGTEILKALGRPGWRGLEESVRENVAGLA